MPPIKRKWQECDDTDDEMDALKQSEDDLSEEDELSAEELEEFGNLCVTKVFETLRLKWSDLINQQQAIQPFPPELLHLVKLMESCLKKC